MKLEKDKKYTITELRSMRTQIVHDSSILDKYVNTSIFYKAGEHGKIENASIKTE